MSVGGNKLTNSVITAIEMGFFPQIVTDYPTIN